MEFRQAFDYFVSKCFQFTFDDTADQRFSNCHVIWNGVEFGVMYQDHMSLMDGDGTVKSYEYDGFYPDKEIYDLADRFRMNIHLQISLKGKSIIETKRERANQVRDYFARKRAAE